MRSLARRTRHTVWPVSQCPGHCQALLLLQAKQAEPLAEFTQGSRLPSLITINSPILVWQGQPSASGILCPHIPFHQRPMCETFQ